MPNMELLHATPSGDDYDQAELAGLFKLLAKRGRKIRQARAESETANPSTETTAQGLPADSPMAV